MEDKNEVVKCTKPTDSHGGNSLIAYLGDGLYMTHDGYQIELRANDCENPTDKVFLEPSVIKNFCELAKAWGYLK